MSTMLMHLQLAFNSITTNKILKVTNLKVFADNKLNFVKMTIFLCDRIENTAGKGHQHFLLFPQCFLSYPEQILRFGSPLICHLQMLSIWTGRKFCLLMKS